MHCVNYRHNERTPVPIIGMHTTVARMKTIKEHLCHLSKHLKDSCVKHKHNFKKTIGQAPKTQQQLACQAH